VTSRRTEIRGFEWGIAIVLCLLGAVLVVLGGTVPTLLPAWAFGVILAVSCIFALGRSLTICRASIRAGGGFSRLGSAAISGGIIFAVVIPGFQLLAGVRKSRLEDLGFPNPHVAADVSKAFAIFILVLGAFYLGETIAEGRGQRFFRSATSRELKPLGRTWESKLTYGILLLIGGVIVVASLGGGQAAFEARGKITGQGAVQLSGYAAPIAIGMGILNRHWGSRTLMVLSALVGVVLVLGAIRTPLIIVAAAAGIRYLYGNADKKMSGRQIIVWVLSIYVGSVLIVALSTYRGQKNSSSGTNVTLVGNIVAAAGDPFAQLQTQGVDTIDGLILSTKVDRSYVGASWTDPDKIVLGFIPHQLWPSKPTWLSNTVTQAYLQFGAGGIFLSGPGYVLIVFGSVVAIPIVFALLGAFSEYLFHRMREPSIWTALLVYLVVRFLFAGDAFDFFHVLGLCLLVVFARAVAQVISLLHRPAEGRPQLGATG
jgi:hypothetical protein